jgi:DNA-binding NarL/FixJ family response regulator
VLIEDSWAISVGLERLLEDLGANVLGAAATIADAQSLISERVPDVALVDISLRGDEQAFGLIDWLHVRGIRVVVMSGYSPHILRRVKADAILQKPVDEAELLATLRPMAARKSPT